jgi:hypothetical protein
MLQDRKVEALGIRMLEVMVGAIVSDTNRGYFASVLECGYFASVLGGGRSPEQP